MSVVRRRVLSRNLVNNEALTHWGRGGGGVVDCCARITKSAEYNLVAVNSFPVIKRHDVGLQRNRDAHSKLFNQDSLPLWELG